ncbi:LacI family DNA-binding transcriptional regulator [Aureimonas endophytica]|uniref:LacI family DNA-binding transcriptional regulator n=1 Tax=Aureimonas endophytica TaxID=2027858 RepID=UPI001667D450|nr:LacI family DNA-binding transcriptional regulator [Aureimonas endophytica]
MARQRHRTMDDLARASGISRPTLSKYFDDPDSVRRSTRERIEAALRLSDYRPNPFARNLNRKRTRTIGLLVPSLTDPFYAEIVSQIETRCMAEGYWPLVMSSQGSAELEARAFEVFLAQKVAGVLAGSLGTPRGDHMMEVLAQEIPLVLFDNAVEFPAPFVGNDNRQSLATIVNYLCRTGEPPAFFDMPAVNHNSRERHALYARAMEELGHEPRFLGTQAEGWKAWDFERFGFEAMEDLLAPGRLLPRSILCANDRIAFGVMAAAFARGLRIGRDRKADLRIAGHDDHPLSRYTCPALTTMAQDIEGMVGRSTGLLFAAINGETPTESRVILEARLVMRQSA